MTLQAVNGGWVATSRKVIHFNVVDSAIVDNEKWYTINVNGLPCQEWIRDQDSTLWVSLKDPASHFRLFDIHEKLYTLLILRWS